MIKVISNAELDRRKEAENPENVAFIDNLAAHLRKKWEAARTHKSEITTRLVNAQKQRAGQYSSSKLAEIRKQGGSELFMQLTATKCRAAESWIRDVLLSAGDKPWTIKPTPLPDIPRHVLDDLNEQAVAETEAYEGEMAVSGEIMENPEGERQGRLEELTEQVQKQSEQAAKKTAERMEKLCLDQTLEGGWVEAMDEAITDIVTFSTAFVKGPVLRKKKAMKWVQVAGKWTYEARDEIKLDFERVSPFDIYPSPDSTDIDSGYLFERHKMSRADLLELIGIKGYKEKEIRSVLEEHSDSLSESSGDWIQGDTERADLEDKDVSKSELIEALEFWGSVSGKLLKEWGVKQEIDESLEYQVNAWLIGSHVIRAVLNPDPLGRRPYSMASYEVVPGSFWGRAIPELMEDVQGVCNATARALVNNMGIASGPQVEVNVDRVPQGEDITDIFPWKIWQTSNDLVGGGSPAVRFNQPSPIIEPLLGVYEKFSRLADDYTGIPAYTYGNASVGGAGRTASGLSMLMSSASKGIKQVVSNLDKGLIQPTIERLYNHNMRYAEDQAVKGDASILARGAISLIQKEQLMVRRNEFLQSTANPLDAQIVGQEGRAAILREVAKTLDMPVDEIIPTKEDIRRNEMMQRQQMMQQQEQQELDPAGNPINGQDTNLF